MSIPPLLTVAIVGVAPHAPTLLYHCPGCRCCQRSPPRRATLRLRGRGDKACSERSCARYRCPSNAGRMVTERCSRGSAAQGLKLGVRRPCCCSAQSKALPGPARRATQRSSRKAQSSLKPHLRHHPAPSLKTSVRRSSPKFRMSVGTLRIARERALQGVVLIFLAAVSIRGFSVMSRHLINCIY